MLVPELTAIVTPSMDAWEVATLAHGLARFAAAAHQHDVRAAVWLRDHQRTDAAWLDLLAQWSWLAALGLPIGISAPAAPPSSQQWALWRARGVDWLHVSERHAAAWLAAPPSLPWSKACHGAEGVTAALSAGAAWVTLSPVAATPSKEGVAPLGWPVLESICRLHGGRVVALGGVDAPQLFDVRRCGAAGAAVQRAWRGDPQALAAAWRQAPTR